ncbi:MAG TPA: endonuclease/exonuclease/phosphatase family protein [Candidatus Limnocylindria bacterium]
MIGGVLFAVIGFLFLLSAIHVFTATVYQSLFGLLPNTTLGVIALIVFALSLLAAVTGSRLGPRRSIAATGFVLAVATLGFTAIRWAPSDLVLSTIAIVAGTQWLTLVHAARSPGRAGPLALALPLAFAVDVALRSTFATIPVVAAPVVLALPLVVIACLLFLAGGIAVLGEPLAWTSTGPRGALGLLAVGPLLLAAETGGTNGAQVAAAGGLGIDGGPSTQIGLLVIGIGMAVAALAVARGVPARPAAAAAITVGAALLWAHLPWLSVAAGAAFAAGILIAASALTSAPPAEARSPWLASLGFGVGWILFVAGTFAHYAYFAVLEPLWVMTAVAVVAVLLVPPSGPARWRTPFAAGLAAVAVLLPAVGLALTPMPSVGGAPRSFRVMTWNVHQGFDAYDIAALERQVDTISHEGPDVLVLEEVVRGWLIDEQHDVLGYLSARLGMPYVFGPTIGDLYGNAILSKYPITDVRRVHYAKEPGAKYQPRGAIIARIGDPGTSGRALIAVTHLDENHDASAVRMEQVRTLLGEVGKDTPAIIACDCNAHPDAPELKLITESGYGDLALQSGGDGLTFPADQPVERLDYIFGVGVIASQGRVVSSTASDHRAVVVNVTLSVR